MDMQSVARALHDYSQMSLREKEALVHSYFKPEYREWAPSPTTKSHMMLYLVLLCPGHNSKWYAPLLFAAMHPEKDYYKDLLKGRPLKGAEDRHLYRESFIGRVSGYSNTLRNTRNPLVEQVDPDQRSNIHIRPVAAYLAETDQETVSDEVSDNVSDDLLLGPYLESLTGEDGGEEDMVSFMLACQQNLEKHRQVLKRVEKEMKPLTEKLAPLLEERRACQRRIDRMSEIVRGLKILDRLPSDLTDSDIHELLVLRQERVRGSIRVLTDEKDAQGL